MYIKVMMIDENGEPKGKAYTYRSDIDVDVDSVVVADFGGKERALMVVEVDIYPGETHFAIKPIIGLASDYDISEEPTLDIEVEKEQLPVIQINFDKLKEALTETLDKYSNIVVTSETLASCKSTQKELAGLRVKVDTYRKDKKKELSKPIVAFEEQCKELIALIEQVEKPIKDGISIFDDVKRQAKREAAENILKEVAETVGLNEKYAPKLTVIDKYCNLTAKESEVKADAESRALALLTEQNREEELIDIIKASIETENERIETKLKFEDFSRMIDRGMVTKDILAEVNASADRIYKAENPEPAPEPTPEPIAPVAPSQEPVIEPQTKEIAKEEPTYHYAVYRITGSEKELMSVSAFLKQSGISYKVTEQGEI